MLQALLGRIRAPRWAQITISTENNKVTLHFQAKHTDGEQETNFQQVYDGELITGKLLTDLLGWLKHTARSFFGTESGGL
jgi:hypothetical protein